MTQYLLSVYDTDGRAEPDPELLEKMYADVDVFNAEIIAAGVWVFGGGLHPADTATVVTVQAGETMITDGPFAETKLPGGIRQGCSHPDPPPP